MELEPQREDLSAWPTSRLVRQALEETKLLARAEVLHAKTELREELRGMKRSGTLLGVAGTLALCSLSVFAAAIGFGLGGVMGLVVVAVILLLAGGGLGFLGVKELPREPLPRTQA